MNFSILPSGNIYNPNSRFYPTNEQMKIIQPKFVLCEYCGITNEYGKPYCLSCGAPLTLERYTVKLFPGYDGILE